MMNIGDSKRNIALLFPLLIIVMVIFVNIVYFISRRQARQA